VDKAFKVDRLMQLARAKFDKLDCNGHTLAGLLYAISEDMHRKY